MARPASPRRQVRRLLEQPDFSQALAQIKGLPPEQTLKYLQAGLAAPEPLTRWRAVTALGAVVAGLQQEHMEAAREFLRRLLWCLNEECGASPWGVAEALGEILAHSETLAPEYASLLLTYIDQEGPNFLDWAPLLSGAVWGAGRLAEAQPRLMAEQGAREYLAPLLEHGQASVRGMAAWALGNLGQGDEASLQGLSDDPATLEVWQDRALRQVTVGELARQAADKLRNIN